MVDKAQACVLACERASERQKCSVSLTVYIAHPITMEYVVVMPNILVVVKVMQLPVTSMAPERRP